MKRANDFQEVERSRERAKSALEAIRRLNVDKQSVREAEKAFADVDEQAEKSTHKASTTMAHAVAKVIENPLAPKHLGLGERAWQIVDGAAAIIDAFKALIQVPLALGVILPKLVLPIAHELPQPLGTPSEVQFVASQQMERRRKWQEDGKSEAERDRRDRLRGSEIGPRMDRATAPASSGEGWDSIRGRFDEVSHQLRNGKPTPQLEAAVRNAQSALDRARSLKEVGQSEIDAMTQEFKELVGQYSKLKKAGNSPAAVDRSSHVRPASSGASKMANEIVKSASQRIATARSVGEVTAALSEAQSKMDHARKAGASDKEKVVLKASIAEIQRLAANRRRHLSVEGET